MAQKIALPVDWNADYFDAFYRPFYFFFFCSFFGAIFTVSPYIHYSFIFPLCFYKLKFLLIFPTDSIIFSFFCHVLSQCFLHLLWFDLIHLTSGLIKGVLWYVSSCLQQICSWWRFFPRSGARVPPREVRRPGMLHIFRYIRFPPVAAPGLLHVPPLGVASSPTGCLNCNLKKF